MKYVRTKGKIYEAIGEDGNWFVVKDIFCGTCTVRKAYVTKQADSIEELCDEYVIFCKEEPNGKLLYYKGFENLKKEFIDFERDKEKVVVYGAIWTDKGLIYVAKMNEKGEFELL